MFVTAGVALLLVMVLAPLDRIFIRLQHMSLMDWLKNHRWTWVVIGVLLVAVTFVFGQGPEGQDQKLWINFGLFTFQPSELLKLALVIFLASYLDEYREVVAHGWRVGPLTLPPLPYLMPMVAMWGLTMGIIVIQRDLGAALLLFGIFLAMLYVATGKGWYALVGLLAFAVGAYGMYQVIGRSSGSRGDLARSLDQRHRLSDRCKASMRWRPAASSVRDWDRARPPWFRRSIPTSSSRHRRRARPAGAIGVLLLYLLLMYRAITSPCGWTSRFLCRLRTLLAIGLTSIIAIQTFIIVGGNLRVIPLTGVTLPFISYGGSSVLINFLIIGLLLRISAGRST